MKVTDIHELVNDVIKEVTGETVVLQEDLSNVVDVGTAILDDSNGWKDNYVNKLINRIGKTLFDDRVYKGNALSVYMDNWEYGSITQKIRGELPEATSNPSNRLVDGVDYSPHVFYQPKVSVKYFNSLTDWQINMSFTHRQLKQSFANANELNAFISMLSNNVEKVMTMEFDALIRSTINSMTGDTLVFARNAPVNNIAVNLLAEYLEDTGITLTKKQAIKDPEFIRYAVLKIKLMTSRLSTASTLFNMGGTKKFTTSEYLHLIMLSEFKAAADIYLQSDTYNKEFTQLPNSEVVPFWQGSGKDYGFESTSSINVITGSGEEVEQDGILAVMFDRNALGVTKLDKRITSQNNPLGEFYTNFYKVDAGYFNDADENFIVFYLGEVGE